MQLIVEDFESLSPVVLHPEPMTDDAFYDFCQQYPDCTVERTAEGEILIMPPPGGESGFQNYDLNGQLWQWAERDGRGRGFDSSTDFMLPNNAARSPDAAWISRSRLDRLPKERKRKFIRLCPEFVVELRSPSDRLNRLQAKMQEWIDNGAEFGWLIDPDHRIVYVYRPGREPEKLVNPDRIAGEGPVAGFILNLRNIWAGL